MNAMVLVLLSLAGSIPEPGATSVAQCVDAALEKPALFTHHLVRCARALPTEAILDGLSHEHERDAVTQRFRTILWRYVLDSQSDRFKSSDATRWLEEIEWHAPVSLHGDLVRSMGHKRGTVTALTARARAKRDAFGRLCALAAISQGSNDPVVEGLVWDAWLDAPGFWVEYAMARSSALMQRLREHLRTLRATKGSPRREDFDLLRQFDVEWVWEELLTWSASPDKAVARNAILAMAGGRLVEPVPERHRSRVRDGLLTLARDPDDDTRKVALGTWAKLASRKPPREELDVALEFAHADPVARHALAPFLALFAADEPTVRPMLFDSLYSRDSISWMLPEIIVAAPGVACWLPAELLPRLRALTDPKAPDWYGTIELATSLVDKVWPGRAHGRPLDEGGGSGIGYCANYVGGPPDQRIDAALFGLERPAHDLLYPPSSAQQTTPADEERWKAEHAKRAEEKRKAQLVKRDRLVAVLSDLPELPAGYICNGAGKPSAHLGQAPTGRAPELVLSAGMSVAMMGSVLDWMLEAPDGTVASRGTLGVEAVAGQPMWMRAHRSVVARPDNWYRGPGTYTLSFPDSEGAVRMSPRSFPVDATDEQLTVMLSSGGGMRHELTRQRPALAEVSVTLKEEDERSVVRIVNGSPDTLQPAGRSWRDAVRVQRPGEDGASSFRKSSLHDALRPGAVKEVVLDTRSKTRSGDFVAVVSFVPAAADLPESVVWVARSASVRRYVSQPRPVDARPSSTCTPGIRPTLLPAIGDGGLVAAAGSRVVRTSREGRSVLIDAGALLRGVASDEKRIVAWGARKVLVSQDAGASFAELPLPDETDLAAVAMLGDGVAAFASDGRAWRRDGGSWVRLAVEHTPWRAFDAAGRVGAALDDCGRLFVTTDAGATWRMSATPDGAWYDLRVADGRLWLVGEHGLVTSADAGLTWASWFGGGACTGLSVRGSSLAAWCGSRLLMRLDEGLVAMASHVPMLPVSHVAFDADGRLLISFGGVLLRLDDGELMPLHGLSPRGAPWPALGTR